MLRQNLFHLNMFTLHWWVPMILDGVVCPPFDLGSHFCPFVWHLSVKEDQGPLFFFSPFSLFNHRVQMVMPPFPTLFASSTLHFWSHLSPFRWTALRQNEFKNHGIVLLTPVLFSFLFLLIRFIVLALLRRNMITNIVKISNHWRFLLQ